MCVLACSDSVPAAAHSVSLTGLKQFITAVHAIFYNRFCYGGKSAMRWRWKMWEQAERKMKGRRDEPNMPKGSAKEGRWGIF